MWVDFTVVRQYNFPTVIRFGAGAAAEIPAYCQKHGLLHPLVVSDPVVAELPFFKTIAASLQQASVDAELFCQIHKNPVKSDVLAGKQCYRDTGRDSIIGIGGGAALDVARAIALSINHHRDLFDYDDLIGGDQFVTEPIPHFITVPTTSGTGSEVGRSAIIAEDETKRKRILFHPTLMARTVFADPLLTMELPSFITAATGMDALTHNLEALLAKGFHPMADGVALQGIRLIAESIEDAVHRPSLESRARMMLASMMGAVAFQKGLGVVHSMAHPLSSLLDTHHGLANAVCLPYGMAYNYRAEPGRLQEAANAFGVSVDSEKSVMDWLSGINSRLSLPVKLSDIGVEEKHLEALSQLALEDFCHPANPRPVGLTDFAALYQQAL